MAPVDMDSSGKGRSTDGARVHYDDFGAAEPALLLMAGWCSDREVFAGLTERLANERRVLALDWRGHGRSESPSTDFGTDGLVADALAVIAASGAEQVVPVALAHAGWVAIELRRRLSTRIPKLVLLDWIVLDPPPPFLGALEGLQDPAHWDQVWATLRGMWKEGVDSPELSRYLDEVMGSYDFGMVARAGREIASAYACQGNPLRALAQLDPLVPTLHLYAQPADPAYLTAQQNFASQNPWFGVERLEAQSHFPMFEVPEAMAATIERFVTRSMELP